MTSAERFSTLFSRVPIENDGQRNVRILGFVADTAERVARRTTNGHNGLHFEFKDASTLTYNPGTQATTWTKPAPKPEDVIEARNYIMAAIHNRRHAA
jgi:hypothetical protein